MPRRFLHFVFKVANRKETAQFYRDVLGMQFLRHEEFVAGCSASCNGPYDGAWSKSMVGYGQEDSHFVVELTYNYGVGAYKLGNDFHGITIYSKKILEKAEKKNYPVTVENGNSIIKSPDGYKFIIVNKNLSGDPVRKITLASSNLKKSVDYWTRLCGMKLYSKESRSAVLGYGDDQCKLELYDIGTKVDHATAFGRIAFSCPRAEILLPRNKTSIEAYGRLAGMQLPDIQKKMKQENQTILTPLISLDTPGKAAVEVVILSDPDGHEICFVGDEAFRELSQLDPAADKLLDEALIADNSDEWFASQGMSKEVA